jgi:hypothetical protein
LNKTLTSTSAGLQCSFAASISGDGNAWTALGSTMVGSTPCLGLAGLAVTSHDNATMNHALFSRRRPMRTWLWLPFVIAFHVTAARADNSVPPPWQQQDVGDVGAPGSVTATFNGETDHWNIAGAGRDIWGTADSFFFVSQWIEDGEISMNAPALENTDPTPKSV